jgi:cyclophilin family peptidyl-prolyl cis-trans isomerase
MSVLKEHKDFLLPVVGIVVVMIILFASLSGDSLFGLDLTNYGGTGNGGSQDVVDQSSKNGKYSSEPQLKIDGRADYRALIKTSKGDIEIDLYEKNAPRTVNNFVFLSDEKYYDGLTFHRIISYPNPFMIQGGDPKGTGTGGPGYTFGDEINAVSLGLDDIKVKDADYLRSQTKYTQSILNKYAERSVMDLYTEIDGYNYTEDVTSMKFKDGVIAMANSGPSTNGSQFFITMTGSGKYLDYLNGKYTVFGEVVSGMDVVDKIANTPTGANNKPKTTIKINSVEIIKK